MNIEKTEICGKRIEKALDIRKMKQSELCKRANVPKSSLSLYLSGAYEPKQDRIYAMAEALNVSDLWLGGYDVPMERAPEQIKADKLATLIHQLRSNDNLIRLMTYAVKLNDKQLVIVESMIKELIKADR